MRGLLLFGLQLLAVPNFDEDTARLGTQACGGTGCWTNHAALADLDGDGDLDAVLPNADGYFTQGATQPLVVLANDSSGNFFDVSGTAVGAYSGWIRQVALGDVDRDGDLDLYAPHAWGGADLFLMNAGDGTFADESATRLAAQSRAGAARFGDVDGDADLDLLIADWGPDPYGPGAISDAHLWLNDGTGVFTNADERLPEVEVPDGTTPVDVDFFDADGDFDLDVLLDSHEDDERLWLNDGSGTFTDASAGFPDGGGLSYGPSACDVDADGDLDVWVDNGGPGFAEQLFINDGSGTFTDESGARLGTQPGEDDNGVVCVDVDADGDLDAAVPTLSGNRERVLENDGSGHFMELANAFSAANDGTLWLEFGDVDGDGRLDALTAQGESSSLDRLYLGTTDQPVDSRAPRFRAVQAVASVQAGNALRVRFGVHDSHVTDIGPRLANARLVWVLDSAQQPQVDAVFVGGDLFQVETGAIPDSAAAGRYRLCATDLMGNEACSDETSFAVTGPGGEDDDDEGDAAGCGCRTTEHGSPASAAALLLALAGIAILQRR